MLEALLQEQRQHQAGVVAAAEVHPPLRCWAGAPAPAAGRGSARRHSAMRSNRSAGATGGPVHHGRRSHVTASSGRSGASSRSVPSGTRRTRSKPVRPSWRVPPSTSQAIARRSRSGCWPGASTSRATTAARVDATTTSSPSPRYSAVRPRGSALTAPVPSTADRHRREPAVEVREGIAQGHPLEEVGELRGPGGRALPRRRPVPGHAPERGEARGADLPPPPDAEAVGVLPARPPGPARPAWPSSRGPTAGTPAGPARAARGARPSTAGSPGRVGRRRPRRSARRGGDAAAGSGIGRTRPALRRSARAGGRARRRGPSAGGRRLDVVAALAEADRPRGRGVVLDAARRPLPDASRCRSRCGRRGPSAARRSRAGVGAVVQPPGQHLQQDLGLAVAAHRAHARPAASRRVGSRGPATGCGAAGDRGRSRPGGRGRG